MKKDTTIVSLSTFVILAPGDVSPGHIILAPLRTNFIAPLSTCMWGNMKGSEIYNSIHECTIPAAFIWLSDGEFLSKTIPNT